MSNWSLINWFEAFGSAFPFEIFINCPIKKPVNCFSPFLYLSISLGFWSITCWIYAKIELTSDSWIKFNSSAIVNGFFVGWLINSGNIFWEATEDEIF